MKKTFERRGLSINLNSNDKASSPSTAKSTKNNTSLYNNIYQSLYSTNASGLSTSKKPHKISTYQPAKEFIVQDQHP